MARVAAVGADRRTARMMALGAITLLLYAGLFLMEDLVLRLSALGGWYGLIPVAIAFIFSLSHGTFTGYFWDVLGVKARK